MRLGFAKFLLPLFRAHITWKYATVYGYALHPIKAFKNGSYPKDC